jgi:hypothetical protein
MLQGGFHESLMFSEFGRRLLKGGWKRVELLDGAEFAGWMFPNFTVESV